MSQHLSHEQFAQCFVGAPAKAELLRHVRECPRCSEELRRFGDTVVSLRGALRDHVSVQQAVPSSGAVRVAGRPASSTNPAWQWVLVTAALMLFGLIPVVTLETRLADSSRETPTDEDASALMDSINLHLSRDLPAPMEPLMVPVMAFGPTNGLMINSGGMR